MNDCSADVNAFGVVGHPLTSACTMRGHERLFASFRSWRDCQQHQPRSGPGACSCSAADTHRDRDAYRQ